VHNLINRRHTALCVTVQVHNSVLVFFYFIRCLCGILCDYKKCLPYLGTLKKRFATHYKMNIFVSFCESIEQTTFFPLSTLAQSETFLVCIRRFQVLVSAGTPTTLRSFVVFLGPFRPSVGISPRLRLQPLPFTLL